MYGDFSRDSTRATMLRRVLMQQGRVLLDADFNDQVASLVHTLETLAADVIGPHGGPAESFRIQATCDALQAAPGHYFVKGLLCESRDGQPISTPIPKAKGHYVVYLEAHERHITAAEDPTWLETALGGAETASRTHVDYRIETKLLQKDDFDELIKLNRYLRYEQEPIGPKHQRYRGCSPFGWIAAYVLDLIKFEKHVPIPISPEERARREAEFYKAFLDKSKLSTPRPQPDKGTLATRYRHGDGATADRYGGFANRLYRVEIHHKGDSKTATFKWSRDNGALVFAAVERQSFSATPARGAHQAPVLKIRDPLNQSARLIEKGQLVELFDREREAARRGHGWLVRVKEKPTNTPGDDPTLTLEAVEKIPQITPLFVRLWDHARSLALEANQPANLQFNALPVSCATGGWFELEDGLQIQFADATGSYQSGDCWLIPVRAQGELPPPIVPSRTEHVYAPLALIEVADGGNVQVHADCRRIILPASLMRSQ